MVGILVNAIFCNEYAFLPTKDDKSSLELVKGVITNLNFNVKEIKVFVDTQSSHIPKYEKLFDKVISVDKNLKTFLEKVNEEFSNCSDILIFNADAPFIDVSYLNMLYDRYKDDFADIGFFEHFPAGFGFQIISKDILPQLIILNQNYDVEFNRNFLIKLIEKDINSFDIENIVSDIDMRKYRLELYSDNELNFQVCCNLFQKVDYNLKSGVIFDEIVKAIDSNPEVIFSKPAYVEIEVTNDCNSKCKICPRSQMKREVEYMSLVNFKKIIDELYNINKSIIISLSFMGEPTLHPEIISMIEYVTTKDGLFLFVETNGILVDESFIKHIEGLNKERYSLIFSMDAIEKSGYEAIRGIESFDKCETNIERFMRFHPKSYIQFTRIKENTDTITKFFERWKDFEDRVIIKKYNDYCRAMPDYKAVDISPLKRFPCWSLRRDLVILSNGDVSFCKQDFDGTSVRGNVFQKSIHDIWKNNVRADYKKHHKGEYQDMCKYCDEWYIFNF